MGNPKQSTELTLAEMMRRANFGVSIEMEIALHPEQEDGPERILVFIGNSSTDFWFGPRDHTGLMTLELDELNMIRHLLNWFADAFDADDKEQT